MTRWDRARPISAQSKNHASLTGGATWKRKLNMNRRNLLIASSLFPLAGIGSSQARHKVLLDTDIGSDIDDAVALAYLLRQPSCELLGITTVTGEPARRASLASALCQAANTPVPIFPGADTPLSIDQTQAHAPQADRLKNYAHQREFPTGEAIEFMRQTIRRNPGEVSLLAVGPFTNIALLFMTDPEIPSLLKELVIMGGKYSDYPTPWGPTEWNAIVDPHATEIIFRQSDLTLRAFGLDITWRLEMTPAEVTRRFRGDALLEIVRDWSEVWFAERELLHFHDPLAALALFEPDVCGYQSGSVAVELGNPERLGVTSFVPSAKSQLSVATSVDKNFFFDRFFSVFEAMR